MQIVGGAGHPGATEVDADGDLMLMDDDEELKEPLEHHHHRGMHMGGSGHENQQHMGVPSQQQQPMDQADVMVSGAA